MVFGHASQAPQVLPSAPVLSPRCMAEVSTFKLSETCVFMPERAPPGGLELRHPPRNWVQGSGESQNREAIKLLYLYHRPTSICSVNSGKGPRAAACELNAAREYTMHLGSCVKWGFCNYICYPNGISVCCVFPWVWVGIKLIGARTGALCCRLKRNFSCL